MLFTLLICTKFLGGKNTLFSNSPDPPPKLFFKSKKTVLNSLITVHKKKCIFARFLNS